MKVVCLCHIEISQIVVPLTMLFAIFSYPLMSKGALRWFGSVQAYDARVMELFFFFKFKNIKTKYLKEIGWSFWQSWKDLDEWDFLELIFQIRRPMPITRYLCGWGKALKSFACEEIMFFRSKKCKNLDRMKHCSQPNQIVKERSSHLYPPCRPLPTRKRNKRKVGVTHHGQIFQLICQSGVGASCLAFLSLNCNGFWISVRKKNERKKERKVVL